MQGPASTVRLGASTRTVPGWRRGPLRPQLGRAIGEPLEVVAEDGGAGASTVIPSPERAVSGPAGVVTPGTPVPPAPAASPEAPPLPPPIAPPTAAAAGGSPLPPLPIPRSRKRPDPAGRCRTTPQPKEDGKSETMKLFHEPRVLRISSGQSGGTWCLRTRSSSATGRDAPGQRSRKSPSGAVNLC